MPSPYIIWPLSQARQNPLSHNLKAQRIAKNELGSFQSLVPQQVVSEV